MARFCVLGIAIVSALSACSVPMGGTGQTADGEVVTGEAVLNASGENVVSISSLDGWSCSGTYTRSRVSAVRQFPLTCSNGVSGMASLSVNAPTADLALQRATVAFKLDNGQSGTVQFGLLS